MTCEEFWEGDSALPAFYRKAYELKQKTLYNEMNFSAWLQGRYTAEAISACFGKRCAYPEKPYELGREETKRSQEEIMIENAERFRALVEAKNKHMKGR